MKVLCISIPGGFQSDITTQSRVRDLTKKYLWSDIEPNSWSSYSHPFSLTALMPPFRWVQAPTALTITASSLLIKHLAHSTSHRDFLKISECLEPARLSVEMLVSLWNLTGASAAVITFCTVRHHYNEWNPDGVSNHRRLDGLLNRWFQEQIKENIKAPPHWPLWGESIGHRWIPLTKGQ